MLAVRTLFGLDPAEWEAIGVWVTGLVTFGLLWLAYRQLKQVSDQRLREEKQRNEEELQRRENEKSLQLNSVQLATADLLGIAAYILMLATTYGTRRAAYERSWTRRPGQTVTAAVYGPRFISEIGDTTERLIATYHRLKFGTTNGQFIEAVERLIDVVNSIVGSATGTEKWDPTSGAATLSEAAKGVLDMVPHSIASTTAERP
jgi:hypothetical protein